MKGNVLGQGGTPEAIYGKRDGTEITLVNSKGQPVVIKQGEYAYMNETVALFLTNPTETIYDRTTPVQVVNAAYDTSGNGGRKLVRLPNTWLKAIVEGSNVSYILTSKDKGTTWLSQSLNSQILSGTLSMVASDDNYLYMYSYTSGTGGRLLKRDKDNFQLSTVEFDSNQTSIGNTSMAIGDDGVIHATWVSKNATYPNSFNIRYSKSTDDGATFSNTEQLSNTNTTGQDHTKPVIVSLSNNNPLILFRYYQTGGSYYIGVAFFNGSTWSFNRTKINMGNYVQDNPSATVQKYGTYVDNIGVAWQGYAVAHPSTYHIFFKSSADNGVSWLPTTPVDVSVGEKPSLTCDKLGVYHVVYERSGVQYGKSSSDGGTTWSVEYTIGNGTNASVCDNYKDFENPMTLFDGGADVKFYGKWTESNSPQIIPSLATATSESELQAIGEGTLKSFGSTDKFYVGFKSKTAQSI